MRLQPAGRVLPPRQAVAAKNESLRPSEKREETETGRKRLLRQAALVKPARALKANGLEPRAPSNLTATLLCASRVPKESSPAPKELPRAKRKREHITTKKQASARPAVPRSDLRENNISFRLVAFPILKKSVRLSAQAVGDNRSRLLTRSSV